MSRIEIDVHSDVVRPWCFIGSRQLQAALDSLGEGLNVVTRHHPYLLYPNVPAGGVDLNAPRRRR